MIEQCLIDFADELGLGYVELNDSSGESLFFMETLDYLPGLRVCPTSQPGHYLCDHEIPDDLLESDNYAVPIHTDKPPITTQDVKALLGNMGFLEVTYLSHRRRQNYQFDEQGA